MESILITIRDLLGIEKEDDGFDGEIIVGINSAIMSLSQLGVVSEDGFVVTSYQDTWSNLFGDLLNIEAAKTYIYLKTKLYFDPPLSSFLIENIKSEIKELEFRLLVQAEIIVEEEV